MNNIAQEMSEDLYKAGKKDAVVIGHYTKANPNINGEGKTKDSQQDYRFQKRVVFHNGKVLFSTDKKGRISEKVIKKYLKREKEESDYDGSKETYK